MSDDDAQKIASQKQINLLKIMVVGCLVLVLTMAAGMFFMFSMVNSEIGAMAKSVEKNRRLAKGEDVPDDEVQSESEEVSNTAKPEFYKLTPSIVATLRQGEQLHYIRVDVQLMLEGPKASEEIGQFSPLIRDKLINMLSSQNYDGILQPETKQKIREEALVAITEILNENKVKSKVKKVLFTNYMVQ